MDRPVGALGTVKRGRGSTGHWGRDLPAFSSWAASTSCECDSRRACGGALLGCALAVDVCVSDAASGVVSLFLRDSCGKEGTTVRNVHSGQGQASCGWNRRRWDTASSVVDPARRTGTGSTVLCRKGLSAFATDRTHTIFIGQYHRDHNADAARKIAAAAATGGGGGIRNVRNLVCTTCALLQCNCKI